MQYIQYPALANPPKIYRLSFSVAYENWKTEGGFELFPSELRKLDPAIQYQRSATTSNFHTSLYVPKKSEN
jgi:hypothetical protein